MAYAGIGKVSKSVGAAKVGLLLSPYFGILCGFKRFSDVENKNEAKK
jgi:hypothetical protein